MNELYHHGILGQKWGVRRYQYEDGSLTPEGKKRYYKNGYDEKGGYTTAGERWHSKEVRSKAKDYTKQLKKLNRNSDTLALMYWNYGDDKEYANKKAILARNQSKAEEWINESNILDKKLDDVAEQYKNTKKQIDEIINKISDDPELLYTVKPSSSYGYSWNYYKNNKALAEKYGKTKAYGSNDGSSRSVSGSKYIVKENSDKYQNDKRYTDERFKRPADRKYLKTYYHYYYY